MLLAAPAHLMQARQKAVTQGPGLVGDGFSISSVHKDRLMIRGND